MAPTLRLPRRSRRLPSDGTDPAGTVRSGACPSPRHRPRGWRRSTCCTGCGCARARRTRPTSRRRPSGWTPTWSGCRRSTATRSAPVASTRPRSWPRLSAPSTGASCRPCTGHRGSTPRGPRPRRTTVRSTTGPTYGVGMASRWPVRRWWVRRFEPAPFSLPLLVPEQPRPRLLRIPDEPRVALAALVDGPAGVFTAVTCHLSFVPGYNIAQLRALTRWVARMPQPVVLLGDLNLPGALPRWSTGWQSLARVPTYPSYQPAGAAGPRAGPGSRSGGRTGRARARPRRQRPLRARPRPRPRRSDPPSRRSARGQPARLTRAASSTAPGRSSWRTTSPRAT